MNTPSALKASPYKIEAKEIEPRYARGWHCLGLANRFTEQPIALNYFGTKLARVWSYLHSADDELFGIARRR
ncbi:MAG TPA: hypothetical protein VGK97_10055 [Spongiibacteraceae bacterium]|jgi:3-ketosteroid 9alpha-monooxygenase subunit A